MKSYAQLADEHKAMREILQALVDWPDFALPKDEAAYNVLLRNMKAIARVGLCDSDKDYRTDDD